MKRLGANFFSSCGYYCGRLWRGRPTRTACALVAILAIVAVYVSSVVAGISQPDRPDQPDQPNRPSVLASPSSPFSRQEPGWLVRTFLPSAETRLGEVRVSAVPHGLRIRTLLYSNLLKRVVAEIEVKSEAGWPEGSRHREQSRRYVALLRAARAEVWSRWRNLGNRERLEHTQNLVIDFVITTTRVAIDVGIPEWLQVDGEKQIATVESFGETQFARDFVHAEAVRILEDQFPERAEELAAMLPLTAER